MSVQSVTVDVPSGLYDVLRQQATDSQRTVQDEMLHVLASAVPSAESASGAVSQLSALDDESLRRAARGRLSEELSAKLESLHLKRQREGLTSAENDECANLVKQVERLMLVRARAAVLLNERGLDVSQLAAP